MSRPAGHLPSEHGAYGHLVFSLVTALGVAGFTAAGVLLAVAVIAGFLAHEPASVLLGLRGPRAARERGPASRRWLAASLIVAVAAGVAAAALMPPAVRWSLAVPAIPTLVMLIALVRGREKSWYGETAAALAFAGVAVPITMASGLPLTRALSTAIPIALLFTLTTLAVRVVILRVRGGGNPAATAATRWTTLIVSAVAALILAALAAARWLPATVLMAAAPGLAAATIIAARPPAPTQLRRLGWTLVAVSTVTAAIVVATA
jgi:hypothetical protein